MFPQVQLRTGSLLDLVYGSHAAVEADQTRRAWGDRISTARAGFLPPSVSTPRPPLAAVAAIVLVALRGSSDAHNDDPNAVLALRQPAGSHYCCRSPRWPPGPIRTARASRPVIDEAL